MLIVVNSRCCLKCANIIQLQTQVTHTQQRFRVVWCLEEASHVLSLVDEWLHVRSWSFNIYILICLRKESVTLLFSQWRHLHGKLDTRAQDTRNTSPEPEPESWHMTGEGRAAEVRGQLWLVGRYRCGWQVKRGKESLRCPIVVCLLGFILL